jgi:hypothetical protein
VVAKIDRWCAILYCTKASNCSLANTRLVLLREEELHREIDRERAEIDIRQSLESTENNEEEWAAIPCGRSPTNHVEL